MLRFDNKLHLWIYSEKHIWDLRILWQVFLKSFEFLKEAEIAKSLWLIKVYGIGFCLYWFQIIFCNMCNPCTLLNKYSFLCFAEIGCVFLRGSRSAILVLVCWPRRVCFLRCSRSFSWLLCKWSRCDCLVDFLRFWED